MRSTAPIAAAAWLGVMVLAVPRPAAAQDVAPAAVDDATPFQCWWRSGAGAIRLGEVVEVVLTCAALERDDLRAVPDESRLTVAAIQMAPFEIVGGSHPPDLRTGTQRLFEYRYQLRIIDADVIGRDVRLPPLAIPYRLESRAGAGIALSGRDLTHLMPQLVFRVVSQVPADAVDIRDSADASLARIDGLRFQATSFRVAALILAALGVLVAASALAPLSARLRGRRQAETLRLADAAILRHAARRLGAIVDAHPDDELDEAAVTDAHALVRLVAGVAIGAGIRQAVVPDGAAIPEGRIAITGGFRRTRVAVTASVTAAAVDDAIAGLPTNADPAARLRLERLRDALALLTRRQYGGTASSEHGALLEALGAARDAALDLRRERRWTAFRPWTAWAALAARRA